MQDKIRSRLNIKPQTRPVVRETKAPEKKASNVPGRISVGHAVGSMDEQVAALKKLSKAPAAPLKPVPAETANHTAQLSLQIKTLSAENARLSGEINKLKEETGKDRSLVEKLRNELDRTIEEKEDALNSLAGFQRRLQELESQNERLKEQVLKRPAANKPAGFAEVTPEKITELVSDLQAQLKGQVSGLEMRGIELELKVGFDPVKESLLLKIPS
ncbi:MAG: hypothetical protein Q8Q07_03545 [Dehalococcoidales bacterium]|nr:hypothetical protein [Dehalococcoidales bacterium]